MSMDEAIRRLRADPSHADLVRDAYLGRDVVESARRFAGSAEWSEVVRLLDGRIVDATVIDLGAGIGAASVAFANEGAAHVIAIEPDPSDEVGRGAMVRLEPLTNVEMIDAVGEGIPLPNGTADIVYCRQVLHHATDLASMLVEMARVLKPGGVLIACREHVVDNDEQLKAFLASHPVNQLAGGEHAFGLDDYLSAISHAGLRLTLSLGPWDSIINAFPGVRSQFELDDYAAAALRRRGFVGNVASRIGLMRWLAWLRIKRPLPGRLYTFVAAKAPVP
jgi:SAM-dependent methyltransferase